eukprot:213357-Rhodomonas_salina.1
MLVENAACVLEQTPPALLFGDRRWGEISVLAEVGRGERRPETSGMSSRGERNVLDSWRSGSRVGIGGEGRGDNG